MKALRSVAAQFLYLCGLIVLMNSSAEARIVVYYAVDSNHTVVPLTLEVKDGISAIRFCKSRTTPEEMKSEQGCEGDSPDIIAPAKDFKKFMILHFETGIDVARLNEGDRRVVLQGRDQNYRNQIACSDNNRIFHPEFHSAMCNQSISTSPENHAQARAVVDEAIASTLADMAGSAVKRVLTNADESSLIYNLISFTFAPELSQRIKFEKWHKKGMASLERENRRNKCLRLSLNPQTCL